jgi:hypothetical protein
VKARFEPLLFELTEMAAAAARPTPCWNSGSRLPAQGAMIWRRSHQCTQVVNLAALRGNAEAKRYRMEIAREPSKREIAEAQRQAWEWLARHRGAPSAALNSAAQQRKKSDNMHSQVFLVALPIA